MVSEADAVTSSSASAKQAVVKPAFDGKTRETVLSFAQRGGKGSFPKASRNLKGGSGLFEFPLCFKELHLHGMAIHGLVFPNPNRREQMRNDAQCVLMVEEEATRIFSLALLVQSREPAADVERRGGASTDPLGLAL